MTGTGGQQGFALGGGGGFELRGLVHLLHGMRLTLTQCQTLLAAHMHKYIRRWVHLIDIYK